MLGITTFLILNKRSKLPYINRILIIFSITSITIYSSIVFEQHSQEIIFSDPVNILQSPTYYGRAIGDQWLLDNGKLLAKLSQYLENHKWY